MRPGSKKWAVALREGYRSGLEEKIGEQLEEAGIEATYEKHTITYEQPVKAKRYTPDWVLPNGIVIETKGRFTTADRQKHLLVQQQHPNLDIRFVFSNPRQRISKKSKTTYAAWCEKYGFRCAAKRVPEGWYKEPRIPSRCEAIAAFKKEEK